MLSETDRTSGLFFYPAKCGATGLPAPVGLYGFTPANAELGGGFLRGGGGRRIGEMGQKMECQDSPHSLKE